MPALIWLSVRVGVIASGSSFTSTIAGLPLARAYGGHGELVERTEDFAPAFARARASGKPAIVEVKLDPEAITPTRTLSQIRAGN